MSAAFVPGCMRLCELASRTVCSICAACGLTVAPPDGGLGLIWISAGGGGLGRRGELGARAMMDSDGVLACRWGEGVVGQACQGRQCQLVRSRPCSIGAFQCLLLELGSLSACSGLAGRVEGASPCKQVDKLLTIHPSRRILHLSTLLFRYLRPYFEERKVGERRRLPSLTCFAPRATTPRVTTMDLDDDAPPELVDTAGPTHDEELSVKVPITIVTGKPSYANSWRTVPDKAHQGTSEPARPRC